MAYFDDADTARVQQSFIRQSMQTPMLEKEEEWDLALRWRDHQDRRALDKLIGSYVRLVVKLASKFKHYGLANSDLVQEGVLGLMQAANRFEPERELRFSTYASWWVKSFMQDYVLRNWSIVRSGSTSQRKSLFFNMRRMRAQLEHHNQNLSSSAMDEKVSKAFNISLGEVQGMFARFSSGDQSLNMTIGAEGESEIGDFLVDETANPEAQVMESHDRQEHQSWVHKAMAKLSPRERQIIIDRRLVDAPMTLEQIGQKIGVSKERVRQLEARAMDKLRHTISDMPVDLSEFRTL